MSRTLLAIAALAASVPSAMGLDIAGAPIVVGHDATAMEVTAARELQRYGRLLCGRQAKIVSVRPVSGVTVLVGTPDSLPALVSHVPTTLGEQGYVIRALGPQRVLVLGARTPIGVQYAVYSLLEELGVGFYLGGDALPPRRDSLEVPDDVSLQAEPALRIRGSLPWYNFLNSPTTWNLEDHRYFFDQMAKMKMNFVGFHDYDHEPFFAYRDDAGWHHGAPAATSENYGWGTIRGMPTEQFGFGTGRLFGQRAFGARASVDMSSDEDGIRRAQSVLAQGLQYAKERGIHPCIGFELVGDPTDPANLARYEQKLRYALARYPMADYIWLWQSEGLGGGAQHDLVTSQLGALVEQYGSAFDYLGSEHRIAEAVRVAVFAQFAHHVIRAARPDIGVIVSGWGGDRWMRFSDFYLGLDQLLPDDVIFSALDNIDPAWEPNVSHVYGELSPSRQRWPIPWFESDGGGDRRDQWGPQCNVKPFTALCRDALQKGAQGLLGIHWQTRGVEEVAAYVAQFAWDPELSYEDFYTRFAQRCYGDALADEMAGIHRALEALGPHWTGAVGQIECGHFDWYTSPARPDPTNLRILADIRRTLVGIRDARQAPQNDRIDYLIATIDFLAHYERAALLLCQEGRITQLAARAEALQAEGRNDEARALAGEGLELLRTCGLREAMQAYATRLTTQGDLGNLATINVKAYAAYEVVRDRLLRLTDAPGWLTAEDPMLGPVLVAKTPPGVAPQGVPLEVRCAALSQGYGVTVTLSYRRPGGPVRRERMAAEHGGGYLARIPASSMGPEGVEYWIEMRDSLGRSVRSPRQAPTVVHAITTAPYPGPVVYPPTLTRTTALAQPKPGAPATLSAVVVTGTEFDRPSGVFEQAGGLALAGEADYGLLTAAVDALGMPSLSWRARAVVRDASDRAAASAEATVDADVGAPSAPTQVSIAPSSSFVMRVSWAAARDDVGVWRYEVHRLEDADDLPTEATRIGITPRTEFFDRAPVFDHPCAYAVIAVDEAGNRSAPARSAPTTVPSPPLLAPPTSVAARPGPGRVVLTWQPPAEGRVSGYRVQREVGGVWTPVGEGLASAAQTLTVAPVESGASVELRVSAIDAAGRDGEPSEPVVAVAAPPIEEPVFEADFSGPMDGLALHGPARIAGGCLDLTEGGYAAHPGSDALQLGGPLTMELWIRPTAIESMPVILCFGHFQDQGYWLQLFSGSVRYYLGNMQIVDAGRPVVGEWHHIAAVYDGTTQVLYINGSEVGRRAVPGIDLRPWPGELRIGQYSDLSPPYQTKGLIDDVRIYQRPLSADEVRQHFAAGRP